MRNVKQGTISAWSNISVFCAIPPASPSLQGQTSHYLALPAPAPPSLHGLCRPLSPAPPFLRGQTSHSLSPSLTCSAMSAWSNMPLLSAPSHLLQHLSMVKHLSLFCPLSPAPPSLHGQASHSFAPSHLRHLCMVKHLTLLDLLTCSTISAWSNISPIHMGHCS
jgi:hypothetical protein